MPHQSCIVKSPPTTKVSTILSRALPMAGMSVLLPQGDVIESLAGGIYLDSGEVHPTPVGADRQPPYNRVQSNEGTRGIVRLQDYISSYKLCSMASNVIAEVQDGRTMTP